MKIGVILAALVGLALFVWLLLHIGVAEVFDTVMAIGPRRLRALLRRGNGGGGAARHRLGRADPPVPSARRAHLHPRAARRATAPATSCPSANSAAS
ncbi:MAG: hypothetical protein WDM81_08965 [Rhizomicrobium sp.]